jgi:hypothetical protein
MATLPIAEYLTEHLSEFDPTFDLRQGTGFEQLFFEPLQFLVQPLIDEVNTLIVAQSFRRILLTTDPDTFDAESVDSLANNLFVYRNTGSLSGGVARVYYSNPVNREWPVSGALFAGSNGASYSNPAPFQITSASMSTQIEGGQYYYDIPVAATTTGNNDLIAGGLVSLNNDPDYLSVTNKLAFEGGEPAETNTQLITRTQNSIAVRDMVTGKGFNAIFFGNFQAFLSEVQPIGFGDPEMMRDVVYNTHIGGRVDGYVKTSSITQGSKTFVGLTLDTTRQSFASTNLVMTGTNPQNVGNPNIDESNNRAPIVQQIKLSTGASYTSTVTSWPVSLASNSYLYLGIDGTFFNIPVAGLNPSATTLNEVINAINTAFGFTVAKPVGATYKLVSPTIGTGSQIATGTPPIGVNAASTLGLGAGVINQGTGPIVFIKGVDYTVDDLNGTITRIPKSPSLVPLQSTGATAANSSTFTDVTAGVFTSVVVNDILTISTGPDAGDYRVLSNGGPFVTAITLDEKLTTTASSVQYSVSQPGIKNNETVYVQYYFNPLSIDIGGLVVLDTYGAVRGIRPGRASSVITDTAFLRINSIELIDPLTLEPIGTVLNGLGGYGAGPYGGGPYGIGSGADYYLVVNVPTARFSAFEDSYIVISSAYLGFSFQVNYDYVPEIQELHAFASSDAERVLDGDVLMKHMVPAYVAGNINYKYDQTNTAIPNQATLQALVNEFISGRPSGTDLVFSEIEQFIIRVTDPYDRFGTEVDNFQLTATILNEDGSTTTVNGTNKLVIPTNTPQFTTKPLSPRIAHWIGENVTLTLLP